MNSTNQFSQQVERDSAVQQQPSPANSVVEELNELELDAIAGGFMFHNRRDMVRFSPTIVSPAVVGKKAGEQATLLGVGSIAFGNKFH